jgi:hypothetical protein
MYPGRTQVADSVQASDIAREVTSASSAPSTFIVVEHWFDELKEKMRTKRND